MSPFHLLPEAWLLHHAMTYGAWAVFASVAIESTGLPVPSESILITVVALAADGDHASFASALPIILAAAVGAVLGDNLGYAIGRRYGLSLFQRVGLTPGRQRLGRYLFQRYGGRIVFVARFVSVLRTCVSLLAGANRMRWSHFLAYNALGGITWAVVVGSAAYLLGEKARTWSWTASLAFGGCALIALGATVILLRRKEQELQAEADAAMPEAA